MSEKLPPPLRPDSPNEYIEKKTDVDLVEQEITDAINRLSDPIEEVKYHSSGHESLKKQNIELDFEYSLAPRDFAPVKEEYQDQAFLELKSFRLSETEKGKVLALSAIVSEDCKVYFCPQLDDLGSYVRLNDDKKEIVLAGDITKPRLILELLHEVGHIYESSNSKPEFVQEENFSRRTVYNRDLAEKLRSERDAWAYAFKKIKPFLGKEKKSVIPKSDAKIFAKYRALRSYTMMIEQKTQSRRAEQHFVWDYWNQFDDGFPEYE